MSEEKTIMSSDAVTKFFESLQYPAAQAVEQYSIWFYSDAIVWMLAGVIMMGAVKFIPDWVDSGGIRFGLIVKIVVSAIGFLVFFSHCADFFAPEGMAIHQLISDIRG